MFKKLISLAFLGIHFFVHFIKKIFRINQRGQKAFTQAYQQDQIFAINTFHRQHMADYSKCLTCKICDVHCPQFSSHPQWPAPSYLVGTVSRSLSDYAHYKLLYHCNDCNRCEQACPQHVPIKNVIQFIKSREHHA